MNAPLPQGALTPAGTDTLRLRVQAIRYEAEGIHAFELVDPSGAPLPEVAAGAHVDVHLGGGLMRSYSRSCGCTSAAASVRCSRCAPA